MLSADLDINPRNFKGELLQRLGWRSGYDVAVQVIDAVMAGADEQLLGGIIIHQTAQMSADSGEDNISGSFMDDYG
jgi:hypothetical protein